MASVALFQFPSCVAARLFRKFLRLVCALNAGIFFLHLASTDFIARHWKGILTVGVFLLLIVMIFTGLSSCAAIIQGGVSSIFPGFLRRP